MFCYGAFEVFCVQVLCQAPFADRRDLKMAQNRFPIIHKHKNLDIGIMAQKINMKRKISYRFMDLNIFYLYPKFGLICVLIAKDT